jgi:hypothetical protein
MAHRSLTEADKEKRRYKMPVSPTFPGVYIEEVPSGVRPIAGVATSVTAFIDFFSRGPLNQPIQIFSPADFERSFGGLHVDSEASYGIQQFFLNGGSQAVVVRVTNSGTPAVAATRVLNGQNGAAQIFRATAGRRLRGGAIEDPGIWGNFLHLEVDYNTVAPNELIDPDGVQDPDELFNVTITEVALQDGLTIVLQTETFRNLTMREGARNNAIEAVNEGSKLVQLNRNGMPAIPGPPFPATFRPDATGTLGDVLVEPPTIPAQGDQLDIVINPGGGGPPRPPVTATLDFQGNIPATYVQLRPFLEAAIRAADPNDPLLSGASVRLERGRYRVLLGRAGAGFLPDATATFNNGAVGTVADDLELSVAQGAFVGLQLVDLQGGDDGDLPDAAGLRGVRLDKTGLYALEDADIFNILCVPRAAQITDNQGADMRQVYLECETYCRERRAFLIVDIPENTNTFDDMQTWLDENETLRDRNAAVYFPRIRIADPLNQNRPRSLGASGTMAGLYAKTDGERGVWKAPAGTEVRLRVQDLDYVLTDAQNGALNPLGINALRNFPVFANVAWGARTLDGADQQASEWKYIPVRRLALFIEESLFRGTKWVVFEPNDEPLWSQIRLNVGAFMQRLFRQGAFQGQTASEAYLVKCDSETTTQADIDLGIVNILVAFAPLKPAEFVIIRIQQLAGQIPT